MASSTLQSPLAAPAHLLTLGLTLLPPPSPLRTVAAAILIPITAVPVYRYPSSADPAAAYGAACMWVLSARIFTLHWFASQRRSEPASASPLEKLPWVFRTMISARGESGPRHPKQIRSRGAYLLHAILRSAALYLILDLARLATLSTRRRPEWHLQFIARSCFGISAAYTMDLIYLTCSIVAVGLHLTPPSEWPPLFGRISDMWSVSRFWGHAWHQMLRPIVLPWARSAAKLLGVGEGGTIYYLLLLGIGIGISACGHFFAAKSATRGLIGEATFWFFMMQWVGIVLETAVRGFWRQLVPKDTAWTRVERAVGYVWTIGWLVYQLKPLIGDFDVMGLNEQSPVPWSVVRWMLGREQE